MHTTVNYTERYPTEAARRKAALADLRNWFGKRRWREVHTLMGTVRSPEQFTAYAGLAGVQGYPVIVWYEELHGPWPTTTTTEQDNA